jgi:hypothetical protein
VQNCADGKFWREIEIQQARPSPQPTLYKLRGNSSRILFLIDCIRVLGFCAACAILRAVLGADCFRVFANIVR